MLSKDRLKIELLDRFSYGNKKFSVNKHDTELMNRLNISLSYLKNLDIDYKFKMWHLFSDTTEDCKCKVCSGIVTEWNKSFNTPFPACSTECKKEYSRIQRLRTCQQVYGGNAPSSSKCVLSKMQETSIKNYGTPNPSSNSCVKQKRANNNLKKYGVTNPTVLTEIREKISIAQNSKSESERLSIIEKSKTTARAWKYVTTPSGKTIKLQGAEPEVYNLLLQEFNESEILCEKENVPSFKYTDKDGKDRRYFPDFYIPKTNTIIEVKSTFTLEQHYQTNTLKRNAVVESGYNIVFYVVGDTRRKTHLIYRGDLTDYEFKVNKKGTP